MGNQPKGKEPEKEVVVKSRNKTKLEGKNIAKPQRILNKRSRSPSNK